MEVWTWRSQYFSVCLSVVGGACGYRFYQDPHAGPPLGVGRVWFRKELTHVTKGLVSGEERLEDTGSIGCDAVVVVFLDACCVYF